MVLEPDGPADPSITYAVVWKQRPRLLSRLPNLKAIFSIGAGVDHIFVDPDLPDVPIVRVVAEEPDRNTWTSMCCGACSTITARACSTARQQKKRIWHEPPQATASDVAVGIMGLGQLGRAAAATLLAAGFRVNGWSRREKTVRRRRHASTASDGLMPFLNATDMLVVLLPLTPATQGIIDYRAVAGAAPRQRARRRGADQCRPRQAAEGCRHLSRARKTAR